MCVDASLIIKKGLQSLQTEPDNMYVMEKEKVRPWLLGFTVKIVCTVLLVSLHFWLNI